MVVQVCSECGQYRGRISGIRRAPWLLTSPPLTPALTFSPVSASPSSCSVSIFYPNKLRSPSSLKKKKPSFCSITLSLPLTPCHAQQANPNLGRASLPPSVPWICSLALPSPTAPTSASPLAVASLDSSHPRSYLTLRWAFLLQLFPLLALMRMLPFLVLFLIYWQHSLLNYTCFFFLPTPCGVFPELNSQFLSLPFLSSP